MTMMMMMMMMMTMTTPTRPKAAGEDDEDAAANDGDDCDPVAGMSTAAERAAAAARASEASLAGVAGVAPGIRGLLRSPEATTGGGAIAAFRRLALSWPSAAPGAASSRTTRTTATRTSSPTWATCRRTGGAGRAAMAKACEDGTIPFATINGYLAPLAVASLGDGGDVASTAAAAIGSLASASRGRPTATFCCGCCARLAATARRGGVQRRGQQGASHPRRGDGARELPRV